MGSAGRIAAIVVGGALVGLALLVVGGGLVVHLTRHRRLADDPKSPADADATLALTAEGLKLGDGRTADKDVVDAIDATVQIGATGPGGTPLFVHRHRSYAATLT